MRQEETDRKLVSTEAHTKENIWKENELSTSRD